VALEEDAKPHTSLFSGCLSALDHDLSPSLSARGTGERYRQA